MALAGLVASPVAAASENNGGISATFPLGSSMLTKDQKAAIKKALASGGSDVSFIVTGTAGKLPGVSDSRVQRLVNARAKAIKAYLVTLGVSKTRITTHVKMTEIGQSPKSIGSYPTPAPTPTPTATAVAAASAPAAPAPTYVLGDKGPGGGIVYYVNATGFSCGPTLAASCKYLEVAPSGWSGGGTDPTLVWSVLANQTSDVTDITNHASAYNDPSEIGLGLKNSIAIVNQGVVGSNNATTQAGAARAYAGGSKNDWYLPTAAELNLLCRWNHGLSPAVGTVCSGVTINSPAYGAGSAGFAGFSIYGSSSEFSNTAAWAQFWFSGMLTVQDSPPKGYNARVRPIRAF